uniref:Uncharacterized protein n=1 Tax=Oryza sativa subsp. japonica TaxID=39947 RepID=Q6YU36_ORYSJ|nr:hypothetical protein [Oryza sativa Japonica Group]BAD31624.1 hypothetical protein [Oryza sativa Japonica Group]
MRRRCPAVAEPSQLRATMRCRRRRGRAVHQAAPPPLGEDEEAIDKCARLLGLISPESLKTGDFCGGDWNIGLVGAAAPPRAGDHGFEVGRGGEVNEKGKEHTDEGEEAGEGEVLPGVSRGNGVVGGGGATRRAPRRWRDAGADEWHEARRDGDGEADKGQDVVRAVPWRREALAGGVCAGRRPEGLNFMVVLVKWHVA